MPADEAFAQMDPCIAGLQTIFATLCTGGYVPDLVDMCACFCHTMFPFFALKRAGWIAPERRCARICQRVVYASAVFNPHEKGFLCLHALYVLLDCPAEMGACSYVTKYTPSYDTLHRSFRQLWTWKNSQSARKEDKRAAGCIAVQVI